MTNSVALKSLKLSAFRGASQPFTMPFEDGKKLTIIYGGNGTGKTTICDAFEFLAAGKLSSLDNRGMGKGLEKYWPTAGREHKEVKIELLTSSGMLVGTMDGKSVSVQPETDRPTINVLRQSQITRLVTSQPAERYDEIKRFIDISSFERAEGVLLQLQKSLRDELGAAIQTKKDNHSALTDHFNAAAGPKEMLPDEWAARKLGEAGRSREQDVAAIGALRMAFEALRKFPANRKQVEDAFGEARDALAAAEDAFAKVVQSVAGDAEETVKLLESAAAYLEKQPGTIETCPVCGSKDNIDGLRQSVAARLTTFAALSAAAKDKAARARSVEQARNAVDQVAKAYEEAAGKVATAQNYAWPDGIALLSVPPPKGIGDLQGWLDEHDRVAATWGDLESGWREEVKITAALRSAFERYQSSCKKVEELEVLAPRVDRAHQICIDERQAFVNEIIGGIAAKVGELYEAVHPGEGLNAISLPLDSKKRASIELEAKFAGKDVPPQAYFSQSHLDTLGLCIFIALALRNDPEATILILDDVLGSIDEPHVDRVIAMLYAASQQFRHTIVTTHYRPWQQKFRWGWLKPDQPCQFVELTDWGIEEGMCLVGCIPEIDRLRELMVARPRDAQAICSKAGVILEFTLDYLTKHYECAVPRRPGDTFTLGDLLDSISSKLKNALTVEIRDKGAAPGAPAKSVVKLGPMLEELKRIAQVRNAMGAHFKAISHELLDSDALQFAENVVAIVDALSCPDCGWPNNGKSGSYWRNNGDTRRLHPLKRPS